MKYSEVVLKTL